MIVAFSESSEGRLGNRDKRAGISNIGTSLPWNSGSGGRDR
jgi:hypothetical protein